MEQLFSDAEAPEQRVEHVFGRRTACQVIERLAGATQLFGDEQRVRVRCRVYESAGGAPKEVPLPPAQGDLAGLGHRHARLLDKRACEFGHACAGDGRHLMHGRHLAPAIRKVAARLDFPSSLRSLAFRSKPEHAIGSGQLLSRPRNAHAFNLIVGFDTQSGHVDESERHSVERHRAQKDVARGARYVGYDGSFRIDQPIE